MQSRLSRVEAILGYHFNDQELISAAITHPSAAEGMGVQASYERLEFLGDAILGAIVSANLFGRFGDMDEGGLTRLKISLIAGSTLSDVAEGLGLAPLIIMGDSEKGTHVRGMHHALENVYEAIVAAIYLDAGLDECRSFVERTLLVNVNPDLAQRPLNPKSMLQQCTQRDLRCAPVYELVETRGPAHDPVFVAAVEVRGERVGLGEGRSKKEAESAAAAEALVALGFIAAPEQHEDSSQPAVEDGEKGA